MISHQLLQHEPVYRDLLELCAQQRIPQETPVELLRFLALVLRRCKGEVPAACGLSPSATMDHLWHLVLLNTRLNEGVVALLGGRVEHSTGGMDDAEEAKAERREAAMTMMERSGWKGSPCATVWGPPAAAVVLAAAEKRMRGEDEEATEERRCLLGGEDNPSCPQGGFPVVVNTLTGRKIVTPPVSSVLDLKHAVSAALDDKDISLCQLRLIYGGKHMEEDDRDLADYGIVYPMAVVSLYLSFRGC